MNGLNGYCKDFNQQIKDAGFWDSMGESLEMMGNDYNKEMLTEHAKLNIKSTHDAYITQKIMLIVSELSEAVEAMRKDNYGIMKKDTFEDEIADALLRTFDLCGQFDIDIEAQLEWKRNYNKTREKLHGKGF
jgi:NTP pyrophosphatase (non-canonical NTP hydrolase)